MRVGALYNDVEPFAAGWMRELIKAGHIADGVVDERSISDLTAADVAGPGQRHFFAGIGGWSAALRLAGVPDDADVWTGSCPCQPFSSAGKGLGVRDPRHLWPAWFALIEECRPAVIFGEQVASRDGLAWLDLVFADLERCGYAVGAADLCAASVGAPHIRQRLYFVAYADELTGNEGRAIGVRCNSGGDAQPRSGSGRRGSAGRMGATDGLSGGRNRRAVPREKGTDSRVRRRVNGPRTAGEDVDSWRGAVWIECADGRRRPVPAEPALFPMAHGVPNRVGLLRGGGNAIVPQQAAAFIEAAMSTSPLRTGKMREG